jgi:uncharacterized protein (DUF58 family)
LIGRSEEQSASALRDAAEGLAANLPPLLVAAERLAASVSMGVHGRRKAGTGESFWQFRRHQNEDSTAAIDWRQSAKSQHLFVREREWEAAEAVWFWRDGSPTMQFASDAVAKIDRANVLALALASLLVRGGERVGLLGQDRPASQSRAGLDAMARRLSAPEAGQETPPHLFKGKSSQLVWLSDFLMPLEALERAMRQVAGDGLSGHLIRIVDPAEEDFPYSGRTRFEPSRGQETELVGRAESVRADYRRRFHAHGEAVTELARRMGWTCLVHRTDRPAQTALLALYANLAALPGPVTQGAGA